MSAKLNHLAITTDNYTTLGMFYRAYFDMNVSGDIDRERRAISVGDGYVGVTLIPRRAGRRAGIDHFGIEVEDFDATCAKLAERYPYIEVVERREATVRVQALSSAPADALLPASVPMIPLVTTLTSLRLATPTAQRSMTWIAGSRRRRSAISR